MDLVAKSGKAPPPVEPEHAAKLLRNRIQTCANIGQTV